MSALPRLTHRPGQDEVVVPLRAEIPRDDGDTPDKIRARRKRWLRMNHRIPPPHYGLLWPVTSAVRTVFRGVFFMLKMSIVGPAILIGIAVAFVIELFSSPHDWDR